MDRKLTYESTTGERLATLEEHRRHAATTTDIVRLEGVINNNNEELRGFIKEAVSQSEINTLKQFVKLWTTGAAIAIPVLTGLIATLLNLVLPKLPR